MVLLLSGLASLGSGALFLHSKCIFCDIGFPGNLSMFRSKNSREDPVPRILVYMVLRIWCFGLASLVHSHRAHYSYTKHYTDLGFTAKYSFHVISSQLFCKNIGWYDWSPNSNGLFRRMLRGSLHSWNATSRVFCKRLVVLLDSKGLPLFISRLSRGFKYKNIGVKDLANRMLASLASIALIYTRDYAAGLYIDSAKYIAWLWDIGKWVGYRFTVILSTYQQNNTLICCFKGSTDFYFKNIERIQIQ